MWLSWTRTLNVLLGRARKTTAQCSCKCRSVWHYFRFLVLFIPVHVSVNKEKQPCNACELETLRPRWWRGLQRRKLPIRFCFLVKAAVKSARDRFSPHALSCTCANTSSTLGGAMRHSVKKKKIINIYSSRRSSSPCGGTYTSFVPAAWSPSYEPSL